MLWTRQMSLTLIAAAAIALSYQAAHARGGYWGGGFAYAPMRHYAVPYAYAYSPSYAYAYRPHFGAYGAYYSPTGYFGSRTYSDGRRVPGTNYNPNQ